MTIWKPIPGREGTHEASDDGQIRSLPRYSVQGRWCEGRVLTQGLLPNGYPVVSLYTSGVGVRRHTVHSLVASAFHGPRPFEGAQVRHLNGDKTDNRAENLRWGTARENMLDRIEHGNDPNVNKTHCTQGHPYEGDNIMWVGPERTRRACAECNRIRARRNQPRRKARRRELRAMGLKAS
jgi:hypothetical protein